MVKVTLEREYAGPGSDAAPRAYGPGRNEAREIPANFTTFLPKRQGPAIWPLVLRAIIEGQQISFTSDAITYLGDVWAAEPQAEKRDEAAFVTEPLPAMTKRPFEDPDSLFLKQKLGWTFESILKPHERFKYGPGESQTTCPLAAIVLLMMREDAVREMFITLRREGTLTEADIIKMLRGCPDVANFKGGGDYMFWCTGEGYVGTTIRFWKRWLEHAKANNKTSRRLGHFLRAALATQRAGGEFFAKVVWLAPEDAPVKVHYMGETLLILILQAANPPHENSLQARLINHYASTAAALASPMSLQHAFTMYFILYVLLIEAGKTGVPVPSIKPTACDLDALPEDELERFRWLDHQFEKQVTDDLPAGSPEPVRFQYINRFLKALNQVSYHFNKPTCAIALASLLATLLHYWPLLDHNQRGYASNTRRAFAEEDAIADAFVEHCMPEILALASQPAPTTVFGHPVAVNDQGEMRVTVSKQVIAAMVRDLKEMLVRLVERWNNMREAAGLDIDQSFYRIKPVRLDEKYLAKTSPATSDAEELGKVDFELVIDEVDEDPADDSATAEEYDSKGGNDEIDDKPENELATKEEANLDDEGPSGAKLLAAAMAQYDDPV